MATATPRRKHHLLFALNSPDTAGGAMTGILELVRALPDDHYCAYLVVPTAPNEDQRLILDAVFDGVAVVAMGGAWVRPRHRSVIRILLSEAKIHGKSLFHARPQWQLRKLLKQWRIDLVYTASALIMEPALAARLVGVPHVWHIKERIGQHGMTKYFVNDRWLIRIIEALSSVVIVMGDFIAEPFALQGRMHKVLKIYDGLNTDAYEGALDTQSVRARLGVEPDEYLVGLVASIAAAWKKHEVFIDAAALIKARVPRARFVHFGPIPEHEGHALQRYNMLCAQIEKVGLKEAFLWGGVADNIPTMMASLDLLVHPTDVEPFGRVAIEAMAAQVPVVGPAAGGLAESVVDGETGLLVPPEDAQALAEAAITLLNDESLRQKMGQAGAHRVRTVFSVEDHVRQIEAVFAGLLEAEGSA